ncbi:hypothetical protein BC831DRAFT_454363 [Entophlyctis helioformis]|nr:hypothetical protein BC831DRAFT_454363 [Entophlyctis helioformis]
MDDNDTAVPGRSSTPVRLPPILAALGLQPTRGLMMVRQTQPKAGKASVGTRIRGDPAATSRKPGALQTARDKSKAGGGGGGDRETAVGDRVKGHAGEHLPHLPLPPPALKRRNRSSDTQRPDRTAGQHDGETSDGNGSNDKENDDRSSRAGRSHTVTFSTKVVVLDREDASGPASDGQGDEDPYGGGSVLPIPETEAEYSSYGMPDPSALSYDRDDTAQYLQSDTDDGRTPHAARSHRHGTKSFHDPTETAASVAGPASTTTSSKSHKKRLWRKKRHAKIITVFEMNPLPHARQQVIPQLDRDLALMRELSKKRRQPDPDRSKFYIRQGPIPDVLSKHFEPHVQLQRVGRSGRLVLPAPSHLNKGGGGRGVRRGKSRAASASGGGGSCADESRAEDGKDGDEDATKSGKDAKHGAQGGDGGAGSALANPEHEKAAVEAKDGVHADAIDATHDDHDDEEGDEEEEGEEGDDAVVEDSKHMTFDDPKPPRRYVQQRRLPIHAHTHTHTHHQSIADKERERDRDHRQYHKPPWHAQHEKQADDSSVGYVHRPFDDHLHADTASVKGERHGRCSADTESMADDTAGGVGGGGCGRNSTASKTTVPGCVHGATQKGQVTSASVYDGPLIFQHMPQPEFNDIDLMLIQRPVVIYCRVARQRTGLGPGGTSHRKNGSGAGGSQSPGTMGGFHGPHGARGKPLTAVSTSSKRLPSLHPSQLTQQQASPKQQHRKQGQSVEK